MELIDEKHNSKTVGTETPCRKLYTTITKDQHGKIIGIFHKLGKEGGCRQAHFTAHIAEQTGNIMAYRLVQRIKRMIANEDILFKNKDSREALEKKLEQVESVVSLKSISNKLEGFKCGQPPVWEKSPEDACDCCIDAMSRNIKNLIQEER